MLGFLLGVSLSINALIIFLYKKDIIIFSLKKGPSLDDDEIDNKDEYKDFTKDDKIDFSNLLRR